MQSTMTSFAPDVPQPYYYPPTHHTHQKQRSNPNSRRVSATTTTSTQNNNNAYSPSRSSRSMRDRRRSSGAISTHSQSQKPKKCIGDYVVGKTLGKGASGKKNYSLDTL
jgi:hypothetical protein